MKKITTGQKILFLLSAISLLYFIYVMYMLGPTYIFNYFWLIITGVLFLIGTMQRRLKSLPRWAKITGILFILVGMVFFLAVEIFIIAGSSMEPRQSADYIIVLGAKVEGTTPAPRLMARLEVAIDYLKENPETKVIVSGGQGADEEISEALAMSNTLRKEGIDLDRIFLEDKSVNTVQNLVFSKEYIEEENASVVIVSSDFHVSRAVNIAEQVGYKDISALPAPSNASGFLIINYYMREFVSVVMDCILRI